MRQTPASLAAQYVRERGEALVTFPDQIYRFHDGTWHRVAEDDLEATVSRWLASWSATTRTTAGKHDAVTGALVAGVTAGVRALAPVVPARASERPIVIATGEPAGDFVAAGEIITFDGRGGFTRRPLTPDVFGRGPAVRLNAHARCPLLDSFIEDAIPDARQREALLKWLAGVLVSSRAGADTPRHLLLAGPADAGGWSGHALAGLLMALASPAAYATPRATRRTSLQLTVQRATEAANGGRACRFSLRGASDKLRAELDALIERAARIRTSPRHWIIEANWSHPAAALPHRYCPPSTLRIDMRASALEHQVALHGRDELCGLLARALRAGGLLGGSGRRPLMLPCQQPRQRLH